MFMKSAFRQICKSFLPLFLLVVLSASSFASQKIDDRVQMVEKYLDEFCSLQEVPIIYAAIKNVLAKMPYKDFLKATNRRRPVLFVGFSDSGTARFASSQEFIVSKGDKPCCQEGFTIIKLGFGLAQAKTSDAIEGVVAHELAHRILDHIRQGHTDCDAERAANALIKTWGFTKEFEEASKMFGHKEGDPAPCQEKEGKPEHSKAPAGSG
jgi:hypothetical protein